MSNGTNGRFKDSGTYEKLLRILTPAGVIGILVLVSNATSSLDTIRQGIKTNCQATANIERALHAEHKRRLRRFSIIFPNPPKCP